MITGLSLLSPLAFMRARGFEPTLITLQPGQGEQDFTLTSGTSRQLRVRRADGSVPEAAYAMWLVGEAGSRHWWAADPLETVSSPAGSFLVPGFDVTGKGVEVFLLVGAADCRPILIEDRLQQEILEVVLPAASIE